MAAEQEMLAGHLLAGDPPTTLHLSFHFSAISIVSRLVLSEYHEPLLAGSL